MPLKDLFGLLRVSETELQDLQKFIHINENLLVY